MTNNIEEFVDEWELKVNAISSIKYRNQDFALVITHEV